MVTRAIYYGMGIADNPNVDDYYTKARGFSIAYSPDDDLEVIEEMRIAAAELKRGDDANEREGSNKESSSDDETTSEEVGPRRTGLMRMKQSVMASPSSERKSRRYLRVLIKCVIYNLSL